MQSYNFSTNIGLFAILNKVKNTIFPHFYIKTSLSSYLFRKVTTKETKVSSWRTRLPMFFALDQSADEGGTMN